MATLGGNGRESLKNGVSTSAGSSVIATTSVPVDVAYAITSGTDALLGPHHEAQNIRRRVLPSASVAGGIPRNAASVTGGAALPTLGGAGRAGHFCGSGLGTRVSRIRSVPRTTSSGAGSSIFES